jgi:gentisate 1,2-dioxygenase
MALIKDVDSILKGRKVKVRKAGEQFEHTSLLPDDEWYPKAVRTKIRPARWNWDDCHAKLQEIASSPIPGADRRFIILVNNDTEEMASTAPGALIGMTILNPGEGLKPHRHNSFAIYQHVNDGDEQAIILTVQDFPLLAAQRSLLFEEPRGIENIKQVSKKFVPHRDTADSFKLDI